MPNAISARRPLGSGPFEIVPDQPRHDGGVSAFLNGSEMTFVSMKIKFSPCIGLPILADEQPPGLISFPQVAEELSRSETRLARRRRNLVGFERTAGR